MRNTGLVRQMTQTCWCPLDSLGLLELWLLILTASRAFLPCGQFLLASERPVLLWPTHKMPGARSWVLPGSHLSLICSPPYHTESSLMAGTCLVHIWTPSTSLGTEKVFNNDLLFRGKTLALLKGSKRGSISLILHSDTGSSHWKHPGRALTSG